MPLIVAGVPLSLRDLAPLRVTVGSEDVTSYLGDSWTFSNVDPGGHEACSLTFPRDMESTIRGLPIRIMSGLKTAWEGRVQQVQRSLGHNTIVTGEGYGNLLKDAAGSMVFVDRDLTRWQQPSYSRQLTMVNGNQQLAGTQVAADPTNNLPAVVQQFTDSWVSPNIPVGEAWYDAGPENLLASIYFNSLTSNAAALLTGVAAKLFFSTDDLFTSSQASSNQATSSGASGYFLNNTGSYRRAAMQFFASTGQGAAGASYQQFWRNLAVYGNHGLTRRGSDPGGFYPSDIFGWVVSQIAGLQAGVIQATDASGYIMPHSVYYTPVTLDTISGDMATAQGWHWGVWESLSPLTGNPLPRADFRPRPGPGAFTAFCLRRDCDTLDIREDLSQQYNQAVVTWTNVDGTQGAVTVTVDNPILDQAGIPSRTVVFQGGTMTPATAALFGAEALALTNAQARVAGTADIIAAIDGGVRPAWDLRAGIDRLRIGDTPSVDAWGGASDYPITRVETSISSSGFTVSVELGSGAQLVETLQARLASATALAAQGGI